MHLTWQFLVRDYFTLEMEAEVSMKSQWIFSRICGVASQKAEIFIVTAMTTLWGNTTLNRHVDNKIKDMGILFHPFCVMVRCISSKRTKHPKHLSWVTLLLKRILFSHRFWICCMFETETRIQTCTLMEWVPHSKNLHAIILYFF